MPTLTQKLQSEQLYTLTTPVRNLAPGQRISYQGHRLKVARIFRPLDRSYGWHVHLQPIDIPIVELAPWSEATSADDCAKREQIAAYTTRLDAWEDGTLEVIPEAFELTTDATGDDCLTIGEPPIHVRYVELRSALLDEEGCPVDFKLLHLMTDDPSPSAIRELIGRLYCGRWHYCRHFDPTEAIDDEF